MSFSGRFTLCISFALWVASVATAQDYVPGEILVRYKESFRRDRISMSEFYRKLNVEKVFRYNGILEGYERISIPTDQPIEWALRQLKENPNVEYAQPNFIIRLLPIAKTPDLTPPPSPLGADPDVLNPPNEVIPPVIDPRLQWTYNLKITQSFEAWNKHMGKEVVVADLDTGADYNHEDLSFNMWRNPRPTQGDIVGFDFVHNDPLPFDDNGHGTHTGGTIAAVGGNGKGIAGVAPRASLMALKVFDSHAEGTLATALRAFEYAVSNGAKILSNSWGGEPFRDPMMQDAIERAEKKGVLVVFATGNNGVDIDLEPTYPASYHSKNMITVTATDSNDKLAPFSNYGKNTVDLGAPGVDILSTLPGNHYNFMSGTSMACPHVAAAAALVWGNHPNWTYAEVKAAILKSVDRVPALRDTTVSGGRLNVRRAVEE